MVSTFENDTNLGAALFVRTSWISWSLWTSLSVSGSRGELGHGLANALARSVAALSTRSVALWVGMETWWGNHSTVSMILGDLVVMAHTR